MFLKTSIIILKKWNFSESDIIIKGLNSQGAVMSFIAKSALKSTKRFAGSVLDPISYIKLEYRFAKNNLHSLKQAWFLEDFSKLRTSYHRLSLALYFVKILGQISQEGQRDSSELFHLLGNALKQAETSPNLEALKLFFQIKILFLQGVLPAHLYLKDILQYNISKHHKLQMSLDKQQALSKILDRTLTNYISS